MNREEIINEVMTRLRQDFIAGLDEKSVRSIIVQSVYENTLDALLARREFTFALKDACLEAIKDENGHHKRDVFGRYVYPLPKDFIRKAYADRPNETFAIMADGIHTGGPNTLKIVYVFKQHEEKALSAYFVKAFVAALCFVCADKLNLKSEDKAAFYQEQETLLEEAARIDGYNKPTQKLPKSDFEFAHEEGF